MLRYVSIGFVTLLISFLVSFALFMYYIHDLDYLVPRDATGRQPINGHV